jgi:hypothetical protein
VGFEAYVCIFFSLSRNDKILQKKKKNSDSLAEIRDLTETGLGKTPDLMKRNILRW